MKLGLPYSDLLKLMETDLNHLRIDTLKPDDILRFWLIPMESMLKSLSWNSTLRRKCNTPCWMTVRTNLQI